MEECIKDAKEVMNNCILSGDYSYIRDIMTEARHLGYNEGIQEGIKDGKEEGLREGINTGFKQGLEHGSTQKSLEITHRMKQCGYSLEAICNILNEPPGKISAWLDES